MDSVDTSPLDSIVSAVSLDGQELCVRSIDPAASGLRLDLPANGPSQLHALTGFIYANYYACDPWLYEKGSIDDMTALGLRVSDPSFLEKLKSANPGAGYYDDGWTVVSAEDERVKVQKNGLMLEIRRTRHLPNRERTAQAGAGVSILFPNGATGSAPGFYVAVSDFGPPGGPLIARIYVNIDPSVAPQLLSEIGAPLIERRLPYTLKVVANATAYRRRDSAVLYIRREHYATTAPLVADWVERHRGGISDAVPAFTLRVAHGVGVADEPPPDGQRMSFGEHRCSVVAHGIASWSEEGQHQSGCFAAIVRALRANGLDPVRLHLNGGDSPEYEELPMPQ